MAVIQCPECGKSLKVSDTFAGKRVRCPACQKPFVVPDAEDEVEEVEEVEEVDEGREERVAKRPRRNSNEDRPRPRRRPPRDEDREDISASIVPLVYGILSCILCCPVIGSALGLLALTKANAELDRLPGGKRARAARKQMQIAKILGIIGICLSVVALGVAIVLNIRDMRK